MPSFTTPGKPSGCKGINIEPTGTILFVSDEPEPFEPPMDSPSEVQIAAVSQAENRTDVSHICEIDCQQANGREAEINLDEIWFDTFQREERFLPSVGSTSNFNEITDSLSKIITILENLKENTDNIRSQVQILARKIDSHIESCGQPILNLKESDTKKKTSSSYQPSEPLNREPDATEGTGENMVKIKPYFIKSVKSEKELQSSAINVGELKSPEEIFSKYSNLKTDSKMGALAVKLAREAYFGDAVLIQCTPRGWQDIPALPHTELNQLKAKLFEAFPAFWSSPECFEKRWVIAQDAISQCCKRLRRMNPGGTLPSANCV